jgi:hypothetical protein
MCLTHESHADEGGFMKYLLALAIIITLGCLVYSNHVLREQIVELQQHVMQLEYDSPWAPIRECTNDCHEEVEI